MFYSIQFDDEMLMDFMFGLVTPVSLSDP